VVKPPLKWAGGKRWQLPEIEPVWQRYQDRRLVEPFCGGLAVVTGLMPEKAFLNDINPARHKLLPVAEARDFDLV